MLDSEMFNAGTLRHACTVARSDNALKAGKEGLYHSFFETKSLFGEFIDKKLASIVGPMV